MKKLLRIESIVDASVVIRGVALMQPPKDGKPAMKAFNLLAIAATFAQEHNLSLNDPAFIERFLADAAPRLQTALADPTLIHGSRTERMFEAMVLSLGRFRLFKTEDIGRVHSATNYRAADFRIVLEDGKQWLIEVKNVRCEGSEETADDDVCKVPNLVAGLRRRDGRSIAARDILVTLEHLDSDCA